jgi:hypothetical protein
MKAAPSRYESRRAKLRPAMGRGPFPVEPFPWPAEPDQPGAREQELEQEQTVHGVDVELDWQTIAPGPFSCPIPSSETRPGVYIIARRQAAPDRWTIRKVGESRTLRNRLCVDPSALGPYRRGPAFPAPRQGQGIRYRALVESHGHTIFYSFLPSTILGGRRSVQNLIVRTLSRGGMDATHHTNISRIHRATGDVRVVNVLPPALLAALRRSVQVAAAPLWTYPRAGSPGFDANVLALGAGEQSWETSPLRRRPQP